jgi:stage V sporulation protein G
MRISDIKISLRDDAKLKAFATVTLDDCFVIRGLKIIQSTDRVFVAMPSRRGADGTFRDIAHPIDADSRRVFEDRVLGEYERVRGAHAEA